MFTFTGYKWATEILGLWKFTIINRLIVIKIVLVNVFEDHWAKPESVLHIIHQCTLYSRFYGTQ